MRRYYFDVTTNGQTVIDTHGDELANSDDVLTYVRSFLVEQLPNFLRDGFEGEIRVHVRDTVGPRFNVRLSVELA